MSEALNSAAAAVVAALFLGAGLAAQTDRPADDEGRKLLVKVCGSCHKIDLVTSRRGTRDEWQATIVAMVEKGADASDEDFNAVLDYLTKNYGHDRPATLNINKAPPKEIAAFLSLPQTDGEAIVRYRETNGAFKSWEDLAKVPGLDAKKFEAKKDRIVY